MGESLISEALIRQTIRFHGHSCPGLAIGIRAAELALSEMERSVGEEIVAVVETDMCGVDAIQFLTGCTYGKGNLIHRDYGKCAFSFYRRSDGKGIRIVLRSDALADKGNELEALKKKIGKEGLTPEEPEQLEKAKASRIKRIMGASLEELFETKRIEGPIPQKARILKSLICEVCGEAAMESRTRRLLGQTLCIPCFEVMEKRV